MNRYELVKALKSLLIYHKSCGIEGYMDDACGDLTRVALAGQAEKGKVKASILQGVPGPGDDTMPEQPGALSLAELAVEIGRCQNCSLHRTRQVSTAGSSRADAVKLMIVGDWLTVNAHSAARDGELFGSDQDMMLARMVAAMELSQEEVFITNVIKCSIPETSQPTSEHITSCSSYLELQIEYLRPLLICSMGIIASRLLTAQAKPLSQQRGHLFFYTIGSGLQIPVIPTYHPTFLLQNPEMKKATWADLQAVKKKITG